MAYIIYSLALFVLVAGTFLYLTRIHWLPHFHDTMASVQLLRISFPGSFPGQSYLYSRLPTTFAGDAEAGLSSNTFDLAINVESGDSRAGLDDAAKREILIIMKKRRLLFDDARRVYMEQRFKANGIGSDGRPKDPKFVSFS